MQNEPLIKQLTTQIAGVVKLREILESQVVRQVRFSTEQRSGASMLLVGCDYLVENVTALIATLKLK